MKSNLNLQALKKHWAKISVLVLAAGLFATACNKHDGLSNEEAIASGKGKAIVFATQPLPQGKKNFSVTMGNFDSVGRTWNRLMNWTFNDANGTVAGTSWSWFSDVKTGYAPFTGGSHTCTMDGITATSCNSDAPSGWATSGASIHQSWTGTYTYNTTTGLLTITWSTIAGVATTATDSWNVTLPLSGLARVVLVSNNYTLTHGRGYGSNAPWPNGTGSDVGTAYKNISQIVSAGLPNYTGPNGKNIWAHQWAGGGISIDPAQNGSTTGVWQPAAFSLTSTTTPSVPSPATTLHRYITGAMCSPQAPAGSCRTTRGGSVIHFTISKTRQVAYTIFCACLPDDGSNSNPNDDFPRYIGNKHPMALTQILDDSSVLRGFIGIEAQNMPGYTDFQFQCVDFTNIP